MMVFERGYLILKNDKKYNINSIMDKYCKNWCEKKHSRYTIYFDPKNRVGNYLDKETGYQCTILGLCMDTSNNTIDSNYIAKTICELLRESDRERMYEYLDNLNGRFILLYTNSKSTFIQTDFCGMKTCFYDNQTNNVSSHYELLNELHNRNHIKIWDNYERTENRPWVLPGDYTPYEDIFLLIPNHELNIKDNTITRIWPRSNMLATNFEHSVDIISNTIKNEMETISKHFELVQSLTMGNDSRLSLAAAKTVKDKIKFFTYKNFDIDKIKEGSSVELYDRYYNWKFAEKVSDLYDLQFTTILLDKKTDEELLKIMKINHYHKHIPVATCEYVKNYNENTIHIRSNLIESIRHTYFSRYPNDNLEDVFIKWSDYDKFEYDMETIKTMYNEFIKRNSYDNIYNYNEGDLFYIEYRMGQWIGAVLIENDLAFDTFMLFNCRKIVDIGISTSRVMKDNNDLSTEIIKKLWPELLDLGVPNRVDNTHSLVESNNNILYDFSKDIRGKYQWINNNSELITVKPHLYTAELCFSKCYINDDDDGSITIPLKMTRNKCYSIEIDILCNGLRYGKVGDISYYIAIDNEKIYELDIQQFTNRINQIITEVNPNKDKTTLRVGLHSKKYLSKNYNGQISIRAIIVKPIEKMRNKKFVYSTYDQLMKLKQ